MRKRIAILGLILLVICPANNAQLLWKISGKGLKKPSYLFGTHHLINKLEIKNIDKVMDLCKNMDAVVGEIDMTDMNSVRIKIMHSALMTETTCKQLLSTEDYALADSAFKALTGTGMNQLEVIKPMMLNSMYSVLMYNKINKIEKEQVGIDILFQQAAQQNNKRVLAFETVEKQCAILFNSIPYKRQAEIMIQEIKDKESNMKIMKRLNEAYLAGDMKAGETINKEDKSLTESEKYELIDKRNNSWIQQIPLLIESQQCFIAVGFLHLTGNQGLINQLHHLGYSVTPVQW